ncbi:hypothetical protein ACTXJR_07980 [Glutamicibacter ardleyensis]|uniref:hypothetical protein n=1 Tax=Glutamicibacter ardleyensis TaxID=225894 RepID=UPI003FD03991
MDDVETKPRVVGLLADPGIAQSLANRVAERLENVLNDRYPDGTTWSVKVDPVSLPMNATGQVMLNKHVAGLREKFGWEFVIYLTDVPQYEQGYPVRSIISMEHSAASLVLPSMGMPRRRAVVKFLVEALGELTGGQDPQPRTSSLGRALSVQGSLRNSEDSGDRYDSIKGMRGRVLLVTGMVLGNRPWRLVPRLSSALAGAAATGAFGVFYTSIWSMADYLSFGRLVLITVVSILVLTTWLLFHNRLWESPKGARRREKLLLYNTATVLTVAMAATAMYTLLFIALLLGSLVVIDQAFLSFELDHEATMSEYLNLAWLAASLGTLGGAIGSSFDEVKSVQRATFSQRDYERRNIEFGFTDKTED